MTTTRKRRTPEQLAADYQAKANQQRAKARKMAKDAKIRDQIKLGKAAQAAGLSAEDDLQAHLTLAQMMLEGFGTGGPLGTKGEHHFEGMAKIFRIDQARRDGLRKWWVSKKLPIGPEPDGKQP